MRKQTITPIAIQGVELGLLPPLPSPPPLPDPLRIKMESFFVDLEGDSSPCVIEAVEAAESEIGDIFLGFGDVLGGGHIFLNSNGYEFLISPVGGRLHIQLM